MDQQPVWRRCAARVGEVSVLVPVGSYGGYGQPDHIRIHRATRASRPASAPSSAWVARCAASLSAPSMSRAPCRQPRRAGGVCGNCSLDWATR